MEVIKKFIADEILRTIKLKSLSQKQVALISSSTQPIISNICNYRLDNITCDRLFQICKDIGGKIELTTPQRKHKL